jgi:hypothetical protein
VARRFVWPRNLEKEEAKARYRAAENTATMGCNARKTNSKQVNDTGNSALWFQLKTAPFHASTGVAYVETLWLTDPPYTEFYLRFARCKISQLNSGGKKYIDVYL